MSIGTKIQEIRKAQDLSQEQFAEKYGVTRQTVSNWENNKHYPDMEILKRISDEFDVSFDTLLKDDEVYIKTIDKDMKKIALWKKLLILFFVIIIGLIMSFFAFLHFAFRATPDEKRITSDTDIKMLVDIEGSSPSFAITKTYDAETFDSFSESKKNDIRAGTGGRIEGDVPAVFIDNREKSFVNFRFQDLSYQNQKPKINDIILYTSPGMPIDPIRRDDKKLTYTYKDDTVTLVLSDIFAENELTFSEGDDALVSGEDPEKAKLAVWFCIFEVRYNIGNKEYVSLSSVGVCFSDEINLGF